MQPLTLAAISAVFLLGGLPAIAQTGPARCPTNFWVDPATGEARCLDELGQPNRAAPPNWGNAVEFLDNLKTCTPFRARRTMLTVDVIRGRQGDRCVVETYLADGTQVRVCRLSQASIDLRTNANAYELARAIDNNRMATIINPETERREALDARECARISPESS